MIDLRHPLEVLANRMPRQEIEAFRAQPWAPQFERVRKVIKRLVAQTASRKAVGNRAKLYS